MRTTSHNIVAIAASQEFATVARDVIREAGSQIPVYASANLSDAVLAAQRAEAAGASAIVTSALTGAEIKRQVQIPVVIVHLSALDLLHALHTARGLGNRVAYIGYRGERIRFDSAELFQILGTEVSLYFYENQTELRPLVEKANLANTDVVVAAGQCLLRWSEELGMHGVPVRFNRDAVREALQRAQEVIDHRRRALEQATQLQTIIDVASNGFVSVDGAGAVTVMNAAAETILDIRSAQMVGRKLTDLPLAIQQLIEPGPTTKGQVATYERKALVLSRANQVVGGQPAGYVVAFRDVTEIQRMEQIIRRELGSRGMVARYALSDIKGASPALEQALLRARKYTLSDATVLITGETGTGKELFAHGIHAESKRRNGPFVALNCATLPEALLESELFGYEPGSFTGATKEGKQGLFEQAHQGTIFLDEIGELPLPLQARLLRVLQAREVRRIGADRVVPVNLRVIAATNVDLREAVRAGKFREDLYFRLNVLHLQTPPLRERTGDLPLLIEHLGLRIAAAAGLPMPRITPEALRVCARYGWPGNVRELENFLEKCILLAEDGAVGPELADELLESGLGGSAAASPLSDDPNTLQVRVATLEEMERQIITELWRNWQGERGALARALGISRATLWKKLKLEGAVQGADTN